MDRRGHKSGTGAPLLAATFPRVGSPSIDTARAEVCNAAMKRVPAFAALLVVLAAPAWAGWDEGVAAYDRGDYATALREWRPFAEQGNASAQFNLGVMYGNGQGVTLDYAEAVRWYRKSAEQDDADAQYNLGNIYRTGRGVPQDYAEAERWYRRAAEQSDDSAQYNLGAMYYNGQGVPQDYAEAAKWFRKAADQGKAKAQFNLGVMYDNGYGVPQDYVQAYMWYNLAEAQGRTAAARNRGRVAKLMTPAQIAEAQRRAGKWRPRGQSGAAPDN